MSENLICPSCGKRSYVQSDLIGMICQECGYIGRLAGFNEDRTKIMSQEIPRRRWNLSGGFKAESVRYMDTDGTMVVKVEDNLAPVPLWLWILIGTFLGCGILGIILGVEFI